MLNVSKDFNDAFKNYEREVKMKVKINGQEYSNHDIVSATFEYGSITGSDFAIGSTFSNSLKLTFCKLVEGLKQLDEVVAEIGIVLPNGKTEFVPMGVFIISEEVRQDRNENRTTIECSDRMIMLSDPYESELSYPAKIRDVALEVANLSGVKVDEANFSRLSVNTIEKPVGYTYREMLGIIAQFHVGYATFDRNGLLAIRKLNTTDFKVTPKEYFLKGLERNEIMFRPAGIEVRYGQGENEIFKIGNEKGSVIKLENRVMTEDLLRSMYDEIKSLNFYPYDLKWRGNPAFEAGDWFNVTDTKGNRFNVPNLSYKLEFKGGLTATSSVETVASNKVKFGYKKILDQVVEYTNNAIESQSGSTVHVGVEEPDKAKEGDIWFKEDGDKNDILEYVYNEETGEYEWKVVLSSTLDEEIAKEIEKAKEDAKNAKDKADEVAVSLVEVQKDADEAKASAEQSKVDAGKAMVDANKALLESEITKVEAQKAKEQSDKAIKDATSSMVTAKDALSKATENETSIGGLQVDVDKTKNELKTKANQSDLNTLKGTVTNQQTQITQNATDIKTKAEKTYVDTINNKVDKQQTQINQNSESIKLKAEKQEVTNLKNELDGLEIGGTNLITNTSDKFKKITIDGWNHYPNGISYTILVEEGQQYVVRAYIKNITSDVGVGLRFFWYDKDGKHIRENITQGAKWLQSGESGYFHIVDTAPSGATGLRVSLRNNSGTGKSTIEYRELKVEKGNKPTAWSPAPEDMASADQVKDISASLEVQAGKIEMKADQTVVDSLKNTVNKQGTAITQNSEAIKLKAEKSQVDSLTGKVDKQQTEITQNAEQIKLKASQTEVNTLKGTVTNQQTQITQNANEIKQKASQSLVDSINNKVTNQQAQINLNSENIKLKAEKSEVTNLKNELDGFEIGGTNLITNTSDKFKKITIDGWNHYPNYNFIDVDPDYYYTARVYIKYLETNDKGVGVGLRMFWFDENENIIGENNTHEGTPWITLNNQGYYQITTKPLKDAKKMRVSLRNSVGTGKTVIEYKELKVEKGNKPTAWSPAPEDLATQSDVTSLSASIDVQANQIKNLVTKTDGHSTQLANLTIESNKISSQVVELQNQEIGTQNLLDKSGWYTSSGVKMELLDDKGYEIKASGGKGTGWPRLHNRSVKNIEWEIGSFYTLSFYIKTDKPNMVDISAQIAYGDSTNKVMGTGSFKGKTEYEYHTYTFKYTKKVEMNDLTLQFFLYNTSPSPEDRTIWVKGVKLEKGQKATDWNLSLNDTATQSQITQLSDDILLRVQKGDVINQINLSTEGILIQGQKVHITGNTTIDNSVIKNAMIADGAITNAKIQNATITSAKIAQLDAGKITTGELKSILITGANSYWDLSTGLFKMYNPSDNKQQIIMKNGDITSTDGAGRTISIHNDSLSAQSEGKGIFLKPDFINFTGAGYFRHIELQGQGITISSFQQREGTGEYLNAGLEIESLGTQSYIDFRTGGRRNDFDTRIKSVEGTTANGQGTLQIEAKRFETITNEVRFREAQSIDFNGALANNLPKNLISTAIKGSKSVLSIEKDDTGDNHYFNFRMRDLNHGIRDWGVSTWASDERLKMNIKPTEISGLGLVDKLNVVQFDWKAGGTHESIGLIAQEVEKIYPKAVFENFSEIKQLKPEAFVPVLIKAIQELKSDNERMTRQIIELQLNGKGV